MSRYSTAWPDGDLAEAAAAGFSIERDDTVDVTKDIDGLAALIAAMDMVISVSNSTVHLAGPINVPVWTLVPAGPGRLWYWCEGRDDGPLVSQYAAFPAGRLWRLGPINDLGGGGTSGAAGCSLAVSRISLSALRFFYRKSVIFEGHLPMIRPDQGGYSLVSQSWCVRDECSNG